MATDAQLASFLRGQIPDLVSGVFFVVMGLIAFAGAGIRRRSGVRILVWLGLWSLLFGVNEFLGTRAITLLIPGWALRPANIVQVSISYLLVVVGTLSFLELSIGKLRPVLWGFIAFDLVVAVVGIGRLLLQKSIAAPTIYNNVLSTIVLIILVGVVSVPKLSRRFMIVAGHRVLTVGTLVFAAQALHANLARPFNYSSPGIYSAIGFAVLLLSFAYTALGMVVSNERRLLAIDKELEIARQLQQSILPETTPSVRGVRICSSCLPMTAVAGDFYEFIPIDEHRVGILIADVSGHGVPAALIASMIKVAIQSVNGYARHPAEVMQRLGTLLSANLRGQFVSAGYLWIDTETRIARYSAAGHPPLLCWRSKGQTLEKIESNGLIFGVMQGTEYPEREIPFTAGDRFLLYTDGITEPENDTGEAFGDRKLSEVLRTHASLAADDLSRHLLREVMGWQTAASTQQDDMTLVVVDALT